jgi:hypothetical protein
MGIEYLFNFSVFIFSLNEINPETRVSVHVVKFSYICPILTKLGTCRHMLTKLSNIKCNENPFSGSRIATSGE